MIGYYFEGNFKLWDIYLFYLGISEVECILRIVINGGFILRMGVEWNRKLRMDLSDIGMDCIRYKRF